MVEWYLNNGSCLTGKIAENYLKNKLNNYENLSMKIDNILKECTKLNVIEKDRCINVSVIETCEKLAMIELLLESLLDDIKVNLDTDDLI